MNFRLIDSLWPLLARPLGQLVWRQGRPSPRSTQSNPEASGEPVSRAARLRRVASMVALLGVALSALSLAACHGLRGGNGLLAGRAPVATSGVLQPSVVNDGEMSRAGDFWNTELTAVFRSSNSFLEYDLGKSTPIRAAILVGDDNDNYIVSVSEDQKAWTELWVAGPATGKGQQMRQSDTLNGQGRYIRISARDGDRSYSIAEVQVFSEKPEVFPPAIPSRVGLPGPEGLRSRILLFGLSLAAWLALSSRRNQWFVNLSLAVVPLVGAYLLLRSLQLNWPVEQREVSLVRGVSAGIAAMAILRELLGGKVWPAARGVVMATLSIGAIAAVAGFFNLGHPQFWDAKERQPLFVHNFDMRVYYPIAKYFDELRFDGLYQASVAAYADDDPSAPIESLRHVEFRDLKTHRMRTVRELESEIRNIPKRFSPERWETFKVDMRYFRETMGVRDYLGSMRDHGGNATPVWFSIAYLIFGHTNASNQVLFLGALLDPFLLTLAAAAIWRAYGWRTALISAVVFGANDFYMFGSNWAGATLRHDWMAYLAFGLCAIRLRWWFTGGAFLALSALIRAFPALALVWVALPGIWWAIDYRRVNGRLPTLRQIGTTQQPILRILMGAAVCVAFFFLFSSAMFSFSAWTEWLAKVRLLDRDPHVNHVSLRALVAGSTHLHHDVLRVRMPLFMVGVGLIASILAFLARARPIDQAAALGCLMIPIIFNPANYYIHFIYVLPVLALELRRSQSTRPDSGRGCCEDTINEAPAVSPLDGGVWLVLLGVCVAEYWSVLEADVELHFQYATVLLFAGIGGLFAVLLKRDWRIIASTPEAAMDLFEHYLLEPPPPTTSPAGRAASRQSEDGLESDGPVSGEADDDESPNRGTQSEASREEPAPDSAEPDFGGPRERAPSSVPAGAISKPRKESEPDT